MGSGGKETVKKIKTESGGYISASYKKNLYQDWLEKSKEEGVNFDQLATEFNTKDEEDETGRSGEFEKLQITGGGGGISDYLSRDFRCDRGITVVES